ncbi:Ribonuclease HI [Planctomycetes bacterium CA13]|uniref:Ribonuclease HI n=1 Tax=Novipirellula herctigrandis TaxID=2527986 RepID=A0A5C5YX15_9BACT|nr:Ribonuclease HI [Planctomycetes bacterium CA13]
MLSSSTDLAGANSDDDALPFGDRMISEYLLVCEARATSLTDGVWNFSLESADGTPVFTAGDSEHGDLNRLTLLAAVRGLEAIEGPSSVTLLSNNRYLIRSLADSLPRWRENNFVWEHFGRRIDVQHADLWRRVDRALGIHRVEACLVSSRLVSPVQRPKMMDAGSGREAKRSFESKRCESKNGVTVRIDAPHEAVPANHTAGPVAGHDSDRDPIKRPSDRLRRWLLSGATSAAAAAPARRQLTTAELLEMS